MTIRYSSDQLQRKFSGPPGTPGFPRLGEVLRTEGRLEEAIQICQAGLAVKPFQLSGYLVLGKAFIDAGRLEEAKTQFETALRLDNRCLSAMRHLADLMNKFHAQDAATGYYRSILVLEPWDSEIRALLAEALQAAPSPDLPVPMPEDGFVRPEGLVGDVLEVNFGEVADFLPEQKGALLVDPDLDGFNLPKESEPAPISGQDIEDRMESIFGTDLPNLDRSLALDPEPSVPLMASPAKNALAQTSFTQDAGEVELSTSLDDDRMQAAVTSILDTPASLDPKVLENPDEGQISGEDIEKRLDDLFSLPGETKQGLPGTTIAESSALDNLSLNEMTDAVEVVGMPDPDTAESPLTELLDNSEQEPEAPMEASNALMSTESMLPVGWQTGSDAQPAISGADIEAQLDKLFNLAEPTIPEATHFVERDSETPTYEMDPDQTISMPAMQESSLKEGVTDWLMRQAEESPDLEQTIPEPNLAKSFETASETLIFSAEEAQDINTPGFSTEPTLDSRLSSKASSTAEMPSEPEILGTLAPEDSEGLADTVTIEMVDGNDVAQRLDELFSDETHATETTGMTRPIDDTPSFASESSEIVDSELEKPPTPLAPLLDEEDSYLEEEMPPQGEGGANVATVTLAEIYFQQGLKEQALQIYRQLQEREPENESVQKRISEIEASKSEGEIRGNDSDPRRNRPGLKVPKRKK